MKEAKSEQHNIHHMTLDIMSGFRLFWGVIFGIISLALLITSIMTIVYIFLLIIGRF